MIILLVIMWCCHNFTLIIAAICHGVFSYNLSCTSAIDMQLNVQFITLDPFVRELRIIFVHPKEIFN